MLAHPNIETNDVPKNIKRFVSEARCILPLVANGDVTPIAYPHVWPHDRSQPMETLSQ